VQLQQNNASKYLTKSDQSDLVTSGIAGRCCHLVSHKLSFRKSEATAFLGWGLNPKISPSPGRPGGADVQMASKSVERFKQGARM